MPRAGPRRVQRYSLEFKRKAVALSQLPDVGVQAVADALEIHRFMLTRWRKQAREGTVRGSAALPAKVLGEFNRLADRFDGEAVAALAKPDRRREEYLCTACNMSLVVDVYNRLHSRDELVFCPSCQRCGWSKIRSIAIRMC